MKKLLLTFVIYFIFSAPIFAENPYTQHKTILVLGDSLSAGYNIPLDKGWVNLLRQKLQSKNPETKVINASVSGDTTGQGLARLKPLLEKHKPDLVIIELGGNDGLRGIAPPLIKRNLSTMIDWSKDSSADVLLLGMKIPPNYGKRYADAFHDNYLDLAKEKEVQLVSFFLEGIGGNHELMQKDRIHPNEKAQILLLGNVITFFSKNSLVK